ncbi:TIGR04104 family putative zinc finger protein [Leeuwenhoekiella sp. W20_SRS_FM14]|uniref:TIGR04104 family putative zinc finger protein n=1 Tax=Leeuwenhoekiella sp. W20_SRS_FM14 TaxID=3240270 RepID=UPI003F97F2C5
MSNCPNCKSKLSTLKVLKSFWSLRRYPPFSCPICETKLNHTASNRMSGGLIVGVAIFVSMTYTSNRDFAINKTLITILLMLCIALLLSVVAVQFFKIEKY